MTTQVTLATLTTDFLAAVTNQANGLDEQLKNLDTTYKMERGALVAQITDVKRILNALKAKSAPGGAVTPTGRKPMSAEARANIAAALKARAQRTAAERAGKAEAVAAAPSAATEKQSGTAQKPKVVTNGAK